MICGFWGLVVVPGKTYTQTVETSFRLSNASLTEEIKNNKRTTLNVVVDKKPFTICTLIPEKIEQQMLDLTFTEGEEVTFELTGDNTIHLTGNLVPEIEDTDGEDVDFDTMDTQERLQYLIDNDLIEDDSEDDSDYDSENAEEDDEIIDTSHLIKELNEDEESLSEDEPTLASVKKSQDKPIKRKQNDIISEAQARKQKVKNEIEVSKPKEEEKKQKEKITTKRQLPNGLIIEDKKIGEGPVASKGKKIGIYYIGKLASNGKVFDKNTSGKPFWFTLGKGEVIKGWDQGVAGLQKGGERRLIIPSELAYGKRGAPPDIPGNAELIFDLRLVEIRK